jgi:DNA-binding response OmpR family regulator
MPKLLVIEDETDILKVMYKVLKKDGFDVVVAVDGYQGVDFAHREKPDLIVLDLMLPAGGGLTVLQHLKTSTKTMNIPVVVLTGMQDEVYKKKVIDKGVEAYLEKPYDSKVLIKTIHDVLEK